MDFRRTLPTFCSSSKLTVGFSSCAFCCSSLWIVSYFQISRFQWWRGIVVLSDSVATVFVVVSEINRNRFSFEALGLVPTGVQTVERPHPYVSTGRQKNTTRINPFKLRPSQYKMWHPLIQDFSTSVLTSTLDVKA